MSGMAVLKETIAEIFHHVNDMRDLFLQVSNSEPKEREQLERGNLKSRSDLYPFVNDDGCCLRLFVLACAEELKVAVEKNTRGLFGMNLELMDIKTQLVMIHQQMEFSAMGSNGK